MIKYAVRNAYDIKDTLKSDGATWDKDHKAWIITQAALDKYNARTQTWGMAWVKGWAKATVEQIDI